LSTSFFSANSNVLYQEKRESDLANDRAGTAKRHEKKKKEVFVVVQQKNGKERKIYNAPRELLYLLIFPPLFCRQEHRLGLGHVKFTRA